MRRLFLLVFLLASLSQAQAQLNESDTIPFHIKFTSSGSYLHGVFTRLLLNNRFEVARATKNWGVSTRNDYNYGYTLFKRTENDLNSYNFLYRRPTDRFYPYLMLLMETHYRRKLHFRYQPGTGVSYNLVQGPHNIVKLSAIVSYEHSRYGGNRFVHYEDVSSNIISTWRFTGRYFAKHRIWEDKLRLSYEFWYQQSIIDKNNYRFHTEEVLEVPVNRHVSVRASFRYTYEHIVLEGIKPFDMFLTYGISLGNF